METIHEAESENIDIKTRAATIVLSITGSLLVVVGLAFVCRSPVVV